MRRGLSTSIVVMSDVADPAGSHGGQHLLGEVRPAPCLPCFDHGAREPVGDAHGVVGQHDLSGMAALAQAGHSVDSVLQRDSRHAEVVEAEEGAFGRQRQVVVRVEGAPAVADDDAGEVDAFLGEDPLLLEAPRLWGSRRVGADRHPGGAVGAGHRTQHAFHAGSEPRSVGGALEDSGADPGITDALADLADEEVDHRLLAAEHRARTPEVEVHRDLVVGVDARGHDDVDLGHLRRDRRDARDGATRGRRR